MSASLESELRRIDLSTESRKYKLILHKRFFDQGYGTLGYLKYLIAFFGFASGDWISTIILGLVYVPACYVFGRWWWLTGLATAEMEVGNQFNNFVIEMRKSIKT